MTPLELQPVIFRFGVFELDLRDGEFRRQGSALRLRGKPFEILVCLLERPGEVVTRDELRRRLWGDETYVNFDHSLHSAVNKLRDTLRDSAESPRFIETVPRWGYRFIAPVERVPVDPAIPAVDPGGAVAGSRTGPPGAADAVPPAAEPSRLRGRPMLLAIVAIVGLAGAFYLTNGLGSAVRPESGGSARARLMLAVLPFVDLGGAAGDDYFGDGITGELIAQLGGLNPMRLGVIARTTVSQYKGSGKSVAEIGRELDVEYVLEGSFRRSGSRVRIAVQLIDTVTQTQRWVQTYDEEIADVLALQRQVSSEVVESLAMEVLPEARAGSRDAPVRPEALDAYLQGHAQRARATAEGGRQCIERFGRAIALQPEFAAAYAGLADCYLLLGAPGWEAEPPAGLMSRAKEAVETALRLDPRLPQALAVRALVRLFYDWDLDGAERDVTEAIRINPSFAQAHQYYSTVLTTQGRLDEAVEAARTARELDRLSLTANTTVGVRLYYARRYEEAVGEFQGARALGPDFPVVFWGLGQCAWRLGRLEDAIAQLQRSAELSPTGYYRARLAHALAVAGRRSEALAIRESLALESRERYVSPYHRAIIEAGLGNADALFGWLERAFDERSGWIVFLPAEPEFDPFRQDSRYLALARRADTLSP